MGQATGSRQQAAAGSSQQATAGGLRILFLTAAFCLLPAASHAQTLRFQYKRGQVFQYQVEQTTRVVDSTPEGKSEMSSRVEQTKRWQVLDIGADGVATVQMSLTRLKMQQQLPGGETWEFDSAVPERGHKQLREQLTPLIGKPLVVLRVDAAGKVVEVKSVLQGSASRYESELPFTVVVPGTPPSPPPSRGGEGGVGQSWKRAYRIVLDPPLGTGEKFAAEQSYQAASAGDQVQIRFSTMIKDMPKNPTDRLPLLQMQPQGEAVFDPRLGLVTSARFTSTGVVEGHQGDGSRYEFRSEYREQLVGN